jgi:hypothetical protein
VTLCSRDISVCGWQQEKKGSSRTAKWTNRAVKAMRVHALCDAGNELMKSRVTHDNYVIHLVTDGLAIVVRRREQDDMADVRAHENR